MIKQHKEYKELRNDVASNVDDLTPEQLAELNGDLDKVENNHKITYMMVGGLALGLLVLWFLSL